MLLAGGGPTRRRYGRWGLVVLLGLLAACSRAEAPLPATADPGPVFPAGTTMAAIRSAGVLRVGITSTSRGFGLTDPKSGQVQGLDREIAQLVAQALFGVGDPEDAFHRVAFLPVAREDPDVLVRRGQADIALTARARQQRAPWELSLAGPYLVLAWDVVVSRGGPGDLTGRRVCVADDPGPRRVPDAVRPAELVVARADACARAVQEGRAAAMVASSPVVERLVQRSGGSLRRVPERRTQESYVIGVRPGDEAFRTFLDQRLREVVQDGEWARAFDRTLGTLRLPRPQPPRLGAPPG